MKISKKNLLKIIKKAVVLELDSKEDSEIEDSVVRIIQILEKSGVTGEIGLLKNVDNQDEFEDFIRYIFNEAGLKNKALGSVAMSIAKDFLENPETAATMSKFNF